MDTSPFFVLYAGSRDISAVCKAENGLELMSCEIPDLCPGLIRRPDIILIDPPLTPSGDAMDGALALKWLKTFKAMNFRFPPAFFGIVPPGMDRDDRMDLMDQGFDDLVEWPVSSKRLKIKSRSYVEKNLIEQSLHSKEVSLEKAFAYLDRFKSELKKVKKELRDEKNSLNAALKQVQQMTRERHHLKTLEITLKEGARRNMEGFGNILYTLIQHRVEKNRGHGERVARTALFIAKEMGFGEKKLEDLRKAAMLHEIGLLFLSESHPEPFFRSGEDRLEGKILPDDREMNERVCGQGAYDKTLMIQFPVKGAQLLTHCPGFEGPARIIYALNENSDGTGYPDGLRRRYIPLGSKILAGADELERLKDRGDIRGVDALLQALEVLAGVRLDPVIVGWLEKYVVLHMGADDFKVRGVGVEQLSPGMELGTALFTTTGTKLFSANTVLTRELIDKIIQYHREYPVDATIYIKV